MTTESQKAFEEWHDNLFDVSASTAVKSQYGYPENGHIQMRWQAWQASREHIVAKLKSEEMMERISAALFEYGNKEYCERKAKAAIAAILEAI